jgi:flagellar protein FliO/FliZ
MDYSFLSQILLLLIMLPIVIVLIYVTLKFGGRYMNSMSNSKLIKVVERVQLSQNSFLAVVIIDNKPYVVSSGDKGINILKELDESTLENMKNKNTFDMKAIPLLDKLLSNKFRGNVNNEKKQ